MTVIKLPGVKLPPQPPAEMPYLEPYPAPEFFCAELMRVHVHGAFTRLTFTTVDMIAEDPHAGPQKWQSVKSWCRLPHCRHYTRPSASACQPGPGRGELIAAAIERLSRDSPCPK